MTVKNQTLYDYHRHVIHIINRRINDLEKKMGIHGKNDELDEYYEINGKINELKQMRDWIHFDFKDGCYGKMFDETFWMWHK